MLIDCIGTPVKVDGNEILKDLRLNVAGNHQLRIKMTYLFAESEVPVDIVVFNYSLPKLDKTSLGIHINGKEMITGLTFRVWLGYNFLAKKWILKGNVGSKEIKREMSTFLEIIQVIKDQVKPVYTKHQ